MSPELSPEQSQAQLSEYERLASKTGGLADALEPKPIDDEVSEGVDNAFRKIAPFEEPLTEDELKKAVDIPQVSDEEAAESERRRRMEEVGKKIEEAFQRGEGELPN